MNLTDNLLHTFLINMFTIFCNRILNSLFKINGLFATKIPFIYTSFSVAICFILIPSYNLLFKPLETINFSLIGLLYFISPKFNFFFNILIITRLKFFLPLLLCVVLLYNSIGFFAFSSILMHSIDILSFHAEQNKLPLFSTDFGFDEYNGAYGLISFLFLISLLLDLFHNNLWFQLFCFMTIPFGLSFSHLLGSRFLLAAPFAILPKNLPFDRGSNSFYQSLAVSLGEGGRHHFSSIDPVSFRSADLIVTPEGNLGSKDRVLNGRMQDFLSSSIVTRVRAELASTSPVNYGQLNQAFRSAFLPRDAEGYVKTGPLHQKAALCVFGHDLLLRFKFDFPNGSPIPKRDIFGYFKDPDRGNSNSFSADDRVYIPTGEAALTYSMFTKRLGLLESASLDYNELPKRPEKGNKADAVFKTKGNINYFVDYKCVLVHPGDDESPSQKLIRQIERILDKWKRGNVDETRNIQFFCPHYLDPEHEQEVRDRLASLQTENKRQISFLASHQLTAELRKDDV